MNILIKQDKKLQGLLLLGFCVQIFFSYTQIGFFHPDQHFQIIEFSSYQLHQPNFAKNIWEFNDQIRPTFQIYLFSGLRLLLGFFSIENAFLIIKITQSLTGIVMFLLFNSMAVYYFRDKIKILYIVLLILNFSWCFPFIRSMFSSETLSSILFFGALFYFDKANKKNDLISIVTGFIMMFSFFARFQIAFAIIGFCFWCVFIQKMYRQFLFILIGLIFGFFINTFLDFQFYKCWVITPYNYFESNIIKGVANSFGTSSFLDYMVVLGVVLTAPFLSFILLFIGIKSTIKNIKNVLVLSVLFFIVGHCFIGHKEERFLFPIFCALPIIVGFQLESFIIYTKQKKWLKQLINFFIYSSILLNIFLFIILAITPYSQTVYMSYLLSKKFDRKNVVIYTVNRNPIETESLLQLKYYENSMKNISFKKVKSIDSVLITKAPFLAVEFNQVAGERNKLETFGYKKSFSSSNLLWRVNELLFQNKIATVNDIWTLYELDKN